MRVNNSSSSANEQCSLLLAGARPAHRAPRSQQHVTQPWDLQLQSRALAAGRDEAVGRLLAAVSFPLVRPPGSAPRLLLSTEVLAHSTSVLREQLGAPSHRKGCPWQSPAESQHRPAQAQCLPLQWKSQVYSCRHGKHNSIISRESWSHPMLHCLRDPSFAAAEQGAGCSAAVSVLHTHGRGLLVA